MILGGLIKLLGEIKLFAVYWEKFYVFAKQTVTGTKFAGQGGMMLGSPGISPAYMGVGYIIGPKLASLKLQRWCSGLGIAYSDDPLFSGPFIRSECHGFGLYGQLILRLPPMQPWTKYGLPHSIPYGGILSVRLPLEACW